MAKKIRKNKRQVTPPKAPSRHEKEKAKARADFWQGIGHRLYEGLGLTLVFIGLFLVASLISFTPADPSFNHAADVVHITNHGGIIGAYTSDMFLQFFGAASYALPLALIVWACHFLLHRPLEQATLRVMTLPILMLSLAALCQLTQPFGTDWPAMSGVGNGGLVGLFIAKTLTHFLGDFGAFFLPSLLSLMCLLWLTNLTTRDIYKFGQMLRVQSAVMLRAAIKSIKEIRESNPQLEFAMSSPKSNRPAISKKNAKAAPTVSRPSAELKPASREESEKQTSLPLNLNDNYQLPPLSILEKMEQKIKTESEADLQQNARQIEAHLANFNVEGRITHICPGPVITIYEFEPAPGVKTSQVVGLSEDLARSMSAVSVRIAPIPGKNVLGIELPNAERRSVSLRELIANDPFETHPGKLTVALGVDTGGVPAYADISKWPHALIAGTTGSGKSVAMNAFILSLLYRLPPQQLRFIMIDPKMLELSIYNDIPHLLTPVVTDPGKASVTLKWAVKEMENRYRMMSELGVKNLQSFNAKFAQLQEAGKVPTKLVQTGFDPATGQPKMEEKPLATEPLPYIVVVIDELADLMMVAGKQVETSIARLAQMARAAGIHLLIATQRPSVDVITGLIKANIPTRTSFHVTSKVDSRTVLDQMGAEQLLGKGDMLFMENGAGVPARLHGAFVSEEECIAVAEHLKTQGKPSYITSAIESVESPENGGGGAEGGNGEEADPLYQQAIDLVAREQKASTSFIQRHLQVGYNRAARIVEQMETDGLIGPANHVGKRDIIVRQPPADGY